MSFLLTVKTELVNAISAVGKRARVALSQPLADFQFDWETRPATLAKTLPPLTLAALIEHPIHRAAYCNTPVPAILNEPLTGGAPTKVPAADKAPVVGSIV